MLVELAVSDLGVIAEISVRLGPGMTALTGETGTGKTLVVNAIELLVGGRADSAVVRPGAGEALVEGRFVTAAGEEVVLTRVVPAEGRSRAYVCGRLAPVAHLAELGRGLVDLHGQHAHQSLLAPGEQRAALDRFGAVDGSALAAARAHLGRVGAALADLGGDARARAREMDLLGYQLGELDRAGLDDPDEEAVLADEEAVLADAAAHRHASAAARAALVDDGGGAADAVARALHAVAGRPPFGGL
ncbi:MAG: DNA repair protein RecN, partial [Acidimicrobiales bacterium]